MKGNMCLHLKVTDDAFRVKGKLIRFKRYIVKHNMLTSAIAFPTRFNHGAVTGAAFRKVRSGAVSGAYSRPTVTSTRAWSTRPG